MANGVLKRRMRRIGSEIDAAGASRRHVWSREVYSCTHFVSAMRHSASEGSTIDHTSGTSSLRTEA